MRSVSVATDSTANPAVRALLCLREAHFLAHRPASQIGTSSRGNKSVQRRKGLMHQTILELSPTQPLSCTPWPGVSSTFPPAQTMLGRSTEREGVPVRHVQSCPGHRQSQGFRPTESTARSWRVGRGTADHHAMRGRDKDYTGLPPLGGLPSFPRLDSCSSSSVTKRLCFIICACARC